MPQTLAPFASMGSPELELVVRLLRAHVTGQMESIPLAERGSWAEIARLAEAHRIAPLLAETLTGRNRDANSVDGEAMAALRNVVWTSVSSNLLLTGELVRLLQHFESAGLQVLPFKGPVLAQTVYGDLGLRPFGDLDLLVRPADVWRAAELLAGAGYACEFAWPAWRHRAYALASGHHYGFQHRERPVRVELHWRISPGKLAWPIETEGFWARLGTCEIAGRRLPCNAPEDLLLLLCIHGARHWWSQLNLICDLALLLRSRPDLDWEAVRQRSRDSGSVRALRLGLLMAHRVLGASLPAAVEAETLEDPVVQDLSEDAWRMLVQGVDLEAEHWARWRFYLRLRERFRDRVRYVSGQGINSLFWRSSSSEGPPLPTDRAHPAPENLANPISKPDRDLLVSVVIPTYNRSDSLRRTLGALAHQAPGTPAFEVLVVSDGSTDETDAVVETLTASAPHPLRLIRQAHAGAAAARNRGIEAATGDVVVLLDDDVEPGPGLIAAHAAHHRHGGPVAVIGPMLRDPGLQGKEPLWIDWEHTQLERQYYKVRTGEWHGVGPGNFYTGNASVSRSLLLAVGGFDERFQRQEDVELAWRLCLDCEVRFRYEPLAVGIHRPCRARDAWLDAAYAYGRSDVIRFGSPDSTAEFVRRHWQRRHPLTRRVAGWTLRSPAAAAAARIVLLTAAPLCARLGFRTAALGALSVVYNVRYLEGVRAELGSPTAVQRLLELEPHSARK